MQHILDELAAINDFYNSATGDPMTIEKSKAALAGSVAYKELQMGSLSTTDGGVLNVAIAAATALSAEQQDTILRAVSSNVHTSVIAAAPLARRAPQRFQFPETYYPQSLWDMLESTSNPLGTKMVKLVGGSQDFGLTKPSEDSFKYLAATLMLPSGLTNLTGDQKFTIVQDLKRTFASSTHPRHPAIQHLTVFPTQPSDLPPDHFQAAYTISDPPIVMTKYPISNFAASVPVRKTNASVNIAAASIQALEVAALRDRANGPPPLTPPMAVYGNDNGMQQFMQAIMTGMQQGMQHMFQQQGRPINTPRRATGVPVVFTHGKQSPDGGSRTHAFVNAGAVGDGVDAVGDGATAQHASGQQLSKVIRDGTIGTEAMSHTQHGGDGSVHNAALATFVPPQSLTGSSTDHVHAHVDATVPQLETPVGSHTDVDDGELARMEKLSRDAAESKKRKATDAAKQRKDKDTKRHAMPQPRRLSVKTTPPTTAPSTATKATPTMARDVDVRAAKNA